MIRVCPLGRTLYFKADIDVLQDRYFKKEVRCRSI